MADQDYIKDPGTGGFQGLLGGFADAYTNDLQDQRRRQRDAEDKELDYKRTVLDTMIKTMGDNPANSDYINRALQDYMAIGAAKGNRKPKPGKEGFEGATEQPLLPFLQAVSQGQIPIFGHVQMNPETGMPTGSAQGQSGIPALPPAPFTAQTGTEVPSRRVPGVSASEGTGPSAAAAPPQPAGPTPPPPQHPGTFRMNKSAADAAVEPPAQPTPPAPVAGAPQSMLAPPNTGGMLAPPTEMPAEPESLYNYKPGLFLSAEDRAKVEASQTYEKERAAERALTQSILAAGGTKQDVLYAIMRKRLGANGMGGAGGSGIFAGKMFIAPDGRNFYGSQSKLDGSIYDTSTGERIPGAVLDPGYQTGMAYDDNGHATAWWNSRRPPTAAGGGGTVSETTPVQGRSSRPVPVDDGTGHIHYETPGRASGLPAPPPTATNPEVVRQKAKDEYDKENSEIEAGLQSNDPFKKLSPEQADARKKAAQARYDSAIGYDRGKLGGRLPGRTTGITDPAWTHGTPWHVQKGLPILDAGTGPEWNDMAKLRMRQYLEEANHKRGTDTAITDAVLADAMRNQGLRIDAGLR